MRAFAAENPADFHIFVHFVKIPSLLINFQDRQSPHQSLIESVNILLLSDVSVNSSSLFYLNISHILFCPACLLSRIFSYIALVVLCCVNDSLLVAGECRFHLSTVVVFLKHLTTGTYLVTHFAVQWVTLLAVLCVNDSFSGAGKHFNAF